MKITNQTESVLSIKDGSSITNAFGGLVFLLVGGGLVYLGLANPPGSTGSPLVALIFGTVFGLIGIIEIFGGYSIWRNRLDKVGIYYQQNPE